MTKQVNINTALFLILALLIPLFASLVYYKEGFVNGLIVGTIVGIVSFTLGYYSNIRR